GRVRSPRPGRPRRPRASRARARPRRPPARRTRDRRPLARPNSMRAGRRGLCSGPPGEGGVVVEPRLGLRSKVTHVAVATLLASSSLCLGRLAMPASLGAACTPGTAVADPPTGNEASWTILEDQTTGIIPSVLDNDCTTGLGGVSVSSFNPNHATYNTSADGHVVTVTGDPNFFGNA